MRINVEDGRRSPQDKSWDLPPWGHPLAQGVFPLFLVIEDHLFPIGTAFSVGKKVRFLVSAEHTIGEAIKHDPLLNKLRNTGQLPAKADVKHAQLSVLYQRKTGENRCEIMIWPIEHVDGAPPTDVVFAFPKFVEDYRTIAFPLTFGLPDIGARVFSAGYTDVRVPEGGLPLDEIRAGTFDWAANYSHRFHVVEGQVERIFTQRFAAGFIDGPCFAFDEAIPHGLSGGPVFTPTSHVIGVNSAVTNFFSQPKSLASLLYPVLPIKLSMGMQMGPVRFSGRIPLIDLIAQGSMTTDGSEQQVGLIPDGEDSFIVSPVCKTEMAPFVHDDFRGFEEGKSATASTDAHYRLSLDRDE